MFTETVDRSSSEDSAILYVLPVLWMTLRFQIMGHSHSLANWDRCPTPAKSEAIEYLQVGPKEIRYSIDWTIFVYLDYSVVSVNRNIVRYNKYLVVATVVVVLSVIVIVIVISLEHSTVFFRCVQVQVRVPYLFYF